MLEAVNMDSKDVIMTIAVIVGPILAVQAQMRKRGQIFLAGEEAGSH